MTWSERQREMLGAMGLRVWSAPPPPVPGGTGSGHGADSPDAAFAATLEERTAPAVGLRAPAAGLRAPASAAASSATSVQPARAEPAVPAVQASPAELSARATPPDDPAAAPRPVSAALPAAVAAALSERAVQIAHLSWAELRQGVATCRACMLCESRTQAVFGVGNEHAHWMIVGEAPGENEDLQGEPFVGRAGQLLDNMLRALQLTRAEALPSQQVFIANTLKCRPPRNRNPGPEELAQCEPYLQRQIALVQPRVILAMGRFAIKVLLGSDEAIGRLRGRVHRHQGIPVVATYHPAYLLRQPSDKAKAWEDLCLAASVYQAPAATH